MWKSFERLVLISCFSWFCVLCGFANEVILHRFGYADWPFWLDVIVGVILCPIVIPLGMAIGMGRI